MGPSTSARMSLSPVVEERKSRTRSNSFDVRLEDSVHEDDDILIRAGLVADAGCAWFNLLLSQVLADIQLSTLTKRMMGRGF
jgi:hypothetical protein